MMLISRCALLALYLCLSTSVAAIELFSYRTKIKHLAPGAHSITLNNDAMGLATSVDFIAPSGKTYSIIYDRSMSHESGNRSWVGHIRNFGSDYRVLITYGSDAVFGQLLTPEGYFTIETYGSGIVLIDTQASGRKLAISFESDALPPPNWQELAVQAEHESSFKNLKVTPSPQTIIDVMVLYTASMVTRYGSEAAVRTRIDFLVALANQAYADSEIAITLRVVHALQVAYPDTGSNNTALNDLTNANHASLASVPALRNTYGADLVTMLRSYHRTTHSGCGLAWIGGYNQTPISSYAGYGFSVNGDGTDVDGSGYYCHNVTLAHELGHNMGSMHDRATVASQGGGLGAYAYSFGYGSSGVFGTIMSYISPRVTKFSNPNISTCAGLPCGVSEADPVNSANNALSLNNTRAAVANFRATVVPLTNGRSDFNGDFRSDLLWQNTSIGQGAIWLMNGATQLSASGFALPSDWQIVTTADFNGDGKADILWRNTPYNTAVIWFMNGGTVTGGGTFAIPPGWTITSANDFNGDGKADLLWQNTSIGQGAIWLMNGATQLSASGFALPSGWQIVTTADFNGDGKADLLWRNTPYNTAVIWFMNGGTVTSGGTFAIPLGWTIASANDFNGDGKADLLWQNTSISQGAIWLMNGATQLSASGFALPSGWQIVTTADFNGDGKADLLWRNTPYNTAVIWFMNGGTPVSGGSFIIPPGWTFIAP